MKSLAILYADEHLIAVNKPSGLLVHRSAVDRNETEYAMQIVRNQLGQWVYPLHRLDKATSGVLVFALNKEMAQIMTRSFTERKVSKSYLAVVRGYTEESARIDYPLKEQLDKMTDRLADVNKPAQEAVTDYRRLATVELPYPVGRYETARYSFLHVLPLTGRNHQIRRHLKHIFHPIVGDTTYGDGKHNEFFRTQLDCRRLLLHACDISFEHPVSSKLIRMSAPLDREFSAVLAELNWEKVVLPERT